MEIFRTLIIPKAHVELARNIAASFGPGGENMWTTGLSSNGEEPATHYISSGYIQSEFAYLVPCKTWAFQQSEENEDSSWVVINSESGNAEAVFETSTLQGVETTQDDVNSLFDAADVTEQEPFTAMARLGLQLVKSNIEF